jgi:hypothetical protein
MRRCYKTVRSACSAMTTHPVAVPAGVALAVRVIAAIGITKFQHGYLFPDESDYVNFGNLAASGHLTVSVEGGYGEDLFHEAASFMWPLAVLFKFFGTHVLVAALWAALFGAVTAVLTAVLVRYATNSNGWAAAAGLAVALFPSQILWSSVVLRESMVWAGLAGTAIGVTMFSRAKQWQYLAGATVVTGVSLLSLAYLRYWAFIPAAWAAAAAVWLFRPARPIFARGLCVLLCLFIPVLPGLGIAGSTYVAHGGSDLGYERTVLAEGAKSAFVRPKVVAARQGTKPSATTTPSVIPTAIGDEELVVPKGLRNDLKALPRGLVAFALRPFPWQHGDGLSYDFAALEEILYYPLYVLAAVGLVAYRRRRELIAFPFLVIALLTGIAAEAEGNLGSAFRHRDQLLWALVLLATLGARALHENWRERRAERGTPHDQVRDEQLTLVQASSL